MSDRMMRAAEEIAGRAQADAVESTAKRLERLLPAALIEKDDDRIVIAGKHMLTSWLSLSELRFFEREFF